MFDDDRYEVKVEAAKIIIFAIIYFSTLCVAIGRMLLVVRAPNQKKVVFKVYKYTVIA